MTQWNNGTDPTMIAIELDPHRPRRTKSAAEGQSGTNAQIRGRINEERGGEVEPKLATANEESNSRKQKPMTWGSAESCA